MTELKDRVKEYLAMRLYVRKDAVFRGMGIIEDQQSRITELEAAIENHLKYPLMGTKELKEVLGNE